MTILCLVLDKRDGSWAAFSDSLITSDSEDEGLSLWSPLRPNYGAKKILGFSEVALEEKLGLLEGDLLLGWVNSRATAVAMANRLLARTSDDQIRDIAVGGENSYLLIQRKRNEGYEITYGGPTGLIQSIDVGYYRIIYSGSGSKILQGVKFNNYPYEETGKGQNAVWQALSLLSLYLGEELTGQKSMFYSLRTGGHYRIFYGSPEGIQQLHYNINHWELNDKGAPVVTKLSIPLKRKGIEIFASVRVRENWEMSIEGAAILSPLLQSPRLQQKFEISLEEIILSNLSAATFHFCWGPTERRAFVASRLEPSCTRTTTGLKISPYSEKTLELVGRLLSEVQVPNP